MASGPKPTFRQVAARHRTTSYVIPYQSGGTIVQNLNRQGYLASLAIKFEGTVTVGTGGSLSDPWNALNYFTAVQIRSPQGDYPITLSGRNLYNYNFRRQTGTVEGYPSGLPLNGIPRPDFTNFNPANPGAQAVDHNLFIPISMNLSSNFDSGLLLTQIANNDFQLVLICNTPANMVGSGSAVITSIVGNIYIEATWFELVDESKAQVPNVHTSCRLRDSTNPNLAIGDNYVSYQLGPVLMDHLILLILNGIPDTSNGTNVNYIKLMSNRQIEIDNRRGKDIVRDQFYDFQKQLPSGCYFLNYFDDALPVPNATMARDFINSQMSAQLDTVVNLASSANVANSSVVSVYRELLTLGA